MRNRRYPARLVPAIVLPLLLLLGAWRVAAHSPAAPPIELPTDRPLVRIEVDAAGIYELTYEALMALNIWPNGVNPNRLRMVHNGREIAYQPVGDTDNQFEPGEKIRFYGWGIESRYDKLYVNRNVFWLWERGDGSRIVREPNRPNNPPALGWTSVVTFEQDAFFTPTYVRWNWQFENPPDAWYWDYLASDVAVNYPLTLPHPLADGAEARYTVELFSRNTFDNRATVALAGDPTPTMRVWSGRRSVNVTGSVPQALLGSGHVDLALTPSAVGNSDRTFNLNRITVQYERAFVADDGVLAFNMAAPGTWRFEIAGLADASEVIAWDISNRLRPIAIGGVNPGAPVVVGRSVPADRPLAMVVQAAEATRQPLALDVYQAVDLTPATGAASWLAIAPADFLPALQRLATYRAAADGLATHIVDVAAIYNQYGYGLATPDAIKRYVAQAYAEWGLQYLLLGGDTSQNPTGRPCLIPDPACLRNWNSFLNTPSYVVTDFVFVDRFLGLIPSDFSYALLAEDDLLAEIMVGRMSVNTVAQMDAAVDKTLRYDAAVRAGEAWTQRKLFVADNADAGGEFCLENRQLRDNFMPPSVVAATAELCLDDYLSSGRNVAHMRNDLFARLNSGGTADPRQPGIIVYRGHGGIEDWAGSLVRASTHASLWNNPDYPTVILSADCLDGHFAWTSQQGLAETFLRQRNAANVPVGTAAHWSSSGLGYSFEHTALYNRFYQALYQDGATTIGAAIDSSKRAYYLNGSGSTSELYSMTLQGDPALPLATPRVPTAVALAAAQTAPAAPVALLAVALLALASGGARIWQRARRVRR